MQTIRYTGHKQPGLTPGKWYEGEYDPNYAHGVWWFDDDDGDPRFRNECEPLLGVDVLQHRMSTVLTQQELLAFMRNYRNNPAGARPALLLNSTPGVTVMCAFTWSQTPEGVDYWNAIEERLS